MIFTQVFIAVFIFVTTPLCAFVVQGDFLIQEKTFIIPGDVISISSNFNIFYAREIPTEDFKIYDKNLLGNFKYSEVQFAIRKSDHKKVTSFEIKLKTNLDQFFKNHCTRRSQWSAQPPQGAMTSDVNKQKFAIHHSEGSATSSPATIQSIQRYHMVNKDWPDIGYHFLIGRDGVCFEGRELRWQGAHVQNHNKANIGICFLGCFETSEENNIPTTPDMIEKLAHLVGALAAHYDIELNRKTVKGHKEHKDAHTLCPGNLVLTHLDHIIEEAARVKQEIESNR